MSLDRQAIIETSARISRLREQIAIAKEELRRHEATLDRLLEGRSDSLVSTESATIGTWNEAVKRAGDASLNQRIIQILDTEPNRVFSIAELHAALPGSQADSIRSALARLYSDHKIGKSHIGHYRSVKATDAAPILQEAV